MKILWLSNYTTMSAYALQSRWLVGALQNMGHQVIVLDIRPGGANTAQVGNTTILSTFHDALGNDSILEHYARSQADVCISLVDVWGLNPQTMGQINWWPITPIDHTPVPPAVQNALKAAKGIIALSRFGQAELAKVGFESLYMPHGLDAEIWYPAIAYNEQMQARGRAQLPTDPFLVSFLGVNDSNPSRKGIPELLAAWSMFHHRHSDTLLYLHTTPQGNIPVAGAKNGVDVDVIMRTLNIDSKSVILPDQYRLRTGIPPEALADIARASDVFVLPSRGEGFGVPLIEMQHAGTPVITTDFASGAELCASGWLVDGEIEWGWQNATVLKPGIASIGEKLEQAYTERGNIQRRRQAAEFGRDFEFGYVEQKFVAANITAIAQAIMQAQKVAA